MTAPSLVERQLALAADRYPPALEGRLRDLLEARPWALWCTLYVDSSGRGGEWSWGARGRVSDEACALLGGRPYLTASGPTPEVRGGDSGAGELWGAAHALRAARREWPWLTGAGVHCDNVEAVRALAPGAPRPRFELRRPLADLRSHGVELRGKHVPGHGRAGSEVQRAWNAQADALAGRRR